MARTRTPGIRIDRHGRLIIDKEHRGVGIYLRLGPTSQEHAEQRLADEIARVNAELQRNANPPPRFADCAARYLLQSKSNRSVDVTAWHVRLLTSYLGSLDVHQIQKWAHAVGRFFGILKWVALRVKPPVVAAAN